MQLTRRLGAARLVLQGLGESGRHVAISTIQKTAAHELLSDAVASQRLTGEEMARLSDLILEIQWAPGHAEELLQLISGKTLPKRRKQQDFRAATSYMSYGRWTTFLNPNSDVNAKTDFMANFAADLDCINPTEPTYKRWTAEILAAHFDKDTCRGLSRDSKYAVMDHLKKEHKRIVATKPAPPTYLLKLPTDPRTVYAALFEKLFGHGEEPLQSRLDQTLVIALDNSFGCRGGNKACTALAPAAPASADLGATLAACLPQLLQLFAGAPPDRSGTRPSLPQQRQPGAKRSFRALEESPGHHVESPERVPRRASFPATGAARPAFTLDDLREEHSSESMEASEPVAEEQEMPAAKTAEKRHLGVRQEGFEISAEMTAEKTPDEEKPSKSPGEIMLDAILARDEATKKVAAAKAAEKRQLAAEAKLAAKKAEAMLPTEAKLGVEAKITAKAGVKANIQQGASKKAKVGNAASDKLSAKTTPTLPNKVTKPCMSHERTRSQYLCRMPGQLSVKFRYKFPDGSKGEYPSEAAAKRAADLWVQARQPK